MLDTEAPDLAYSASTWGWTFGPRSLSWIPSAGWTSTLMLDDVLPWRDGSMEKNRPPLAAIVARLVAPRADLSLGFWSWICWNAFAAPGLEGLNSRHELGTATLKRSAWSTNVG